MNDHPDPFRAIIQASYTPCELAAVWQWSDEMIRLEEIQREQLGRPALSAAGIELDS